MTRRFIAVGGLFLWANLAGLAQHSASTSLTVQVRPEARIEPSQMRLSFRISPDGTSDILVSAASLSAVVRALPGQQIRVTARLTSLDGPDGPVAASGVRWRGAIAQAAGGGQQATCASGSFAPGAAGDLVSGWQTSGSIACAVSFELADPRTLSPGVYSGNVSLSVETR
jgi:hypothetical protein